MIILATIIIGLIIYMIYESVSLVFEKNKRDEEHYEWQRKIGQSQMRINKMRMRMDHAQLEELMGNRVWFIATKEGKSTVIGGWKNEWYKKEQWKIDNDNDEEEKTIWFEQGYFIKSQIEPYINSEYEISFQ